MMSYAYDRYLQPHGLNWRDLFDMVPHQVAHCMDAPLLIVCPAHSGSFTYLPVHSSVHVQLKATWVASAEESHFSPTTDDREWGLTQVIVQARKPDFFNYNMSLYEVVTEDGLMRPVMTGAQGAPLASAFRPTNSAMHSPHNPPACLSAPPLEPGLHLMWAVMQGPQDLCDWCNNYLRGFPTPLGLA